VSPLDFPLLADENVPVAVSDALAASGHDLVTVFDVLTLDSDFGLLAVRSGAEYVGIIYVRPGHRSAAFTLETLAAISANAVEVQAPFILVADRRQETVRIRLRDATAEAE
jgi:hypothetical protein